MPPSISNLGLSRSTRTGQHTYRWGKTQKPSPAPGDTAPAWVRVQRLHSTNEARCPYQNVCHPIPLTSIPGLVLIQQACAVRNVIFPHASSIAHISSLRYQARSQPPGNVTRPFDSSLETRDVRCRVPLYYHSELQTACWHTGGAERGTPNATRAPSTT